MPIAAVIQMNSASDVADNLAAARALLAQAAQAGATLAALPENFAIMGRRERDKLAVAEDYDEGLGCGPIQSWLSQTARELNLWIVAGTTPLRASPDKVAAACLVVDAQGRCAARYDKIHLFDVDIPGREERYRESASIERGERIVAVDTPVGRMGLSVCYDVRFPELYRELQAQGARVLCVPAAFTAPTGEAHWETLLRARAIENLCYVLAPAQVGEHASGRRTYGHSMIVNPWGEIIARVAADAPGIAYADIDVAAQAQLREGFPALSHRRLPL